MYTARLVFITRFPSFHLHLHLPFEVLECGVLREVRGVEVVLEPDEVLFDGARGHEAVEDGNGTRLVVRAAATRTAERLLSDDGARALLVVVDVARSVAQAVGRLEKCLAFRGETMYSASANLEREKLRHVRDIHGTGESVGRRSVDEVKGLLEVGILVDVDSQDRAEDLLGHRDRLRIFCENDCRLHEEALGIIP